MSLSNLKYLFLAAVLCLNGCNSNSVKDPEQIGRQVFNFLSKLNKETKADYVNHFISIEEIRELGKNEDIISNVDLRNELTSIRKNDWIKALENNYNELKTSGAEKGIRWENIEYLDFVYEVKIENTIKSVDGDLYFKEDEVTYKLKVFSIFDGKEYKLMTLKKVKKVN